MGVERLQLAVGDWVGENAFRLMPDDPEHVAPTTATVRAGLLTSVEYTWVHPDDGSQSGSLALGAGLDGVVVGLWADSWHQQPDARVLHGEARDGDVRLGYDYVEGAWRWEIVLTPTSGRLLIRMDNVDLASGQRYAAMRMDLRH